jgi:hypothetical protein
LARSEMRVAQKLGMAYRQASSFSTDLLDWFPPIRLKPRTSVRGFFCAQFNVVQIEHLGVDNVTHTH